MEALLDRYAHLLPVRKVAVGILAAGLTYTARRLGVDLGPAEANEAAVAVVGFVAAYMVRA